MNDKKKDFSEKYYLDTQRRLVGSLLVESIDSHQIISIVSEDDFTDPSMSTIFSAIAHLTRTEETISPYSVASELESRGLLSSVGGVAEIEQLSYNGEKWITELPPKNYASIVKDGSVKKSVTEKTSEARDYFKYDSGVSAREGIEQFTHDLNETLYSISDNTTITKVNEDVDNYLNIIRERKRVYEENKDSNDGLQGVPSNIDSLNSYTTGWLPGQLITVAARTGVGKALDLRTPIPTPAGWKTMREIQVGDYVIGKDGKPTKVVFATDVQYNRKCYEVRFSDGSTIIADADHLWLTETWKSRKAESEQRTRKAERKSPFSVDQRWKSEQPSIKTTHDIYETLTVGDEGRKNHSIKIADEIELPQKELSIDPYLFGYWLGDGRSNSPVITVGNEDRESLIENIEKTGMFYSITQQENNSSNIIFSTHEIKRGGNLKNRNHNGRYLSTMGVKNNKHIPYEYLRGSVNQRKALLAGLLDSDGTINKSGRVSFEVTSKRLAYDTAELIRTLGYRVHIGTKKVKGRMPETSVCYNIGFIPNEKVFKLKRKNDRVKDNTRHTVNKRVYVEDIREIESVPVKCIQVDNDDHMYLAGESMIPTHNTVLAVNSAVSAARANKSVLFFSLEMGAEEIQDRIYSSTSSVPMKELKQGDLSEESEGWLQESLEEFRKLKITIDTDPGVSIDNIRAKAIKQAQSDEGLDFIIIDYLQLITTSGRHNNRQEAVADLSRQAKLLAKQLEVPIMVLAQVNRKDKDAEDDRPRLDDIRESHAIAQDSDIVILLHRDARSEEPDPKTYIFLEKNRNGEGNKVITCRSDLACSKFEEIRRATGMNDDDFADSLSENEVADSISETEDMFDGFDDTFPGEVPESQSAKEPSRNTYSDDDLDVFDDFSNDGLGELNFE